jgi:hypothetical protein
MTAGCRLFVGGQHAEMYGERCFSAAHPPHNWRPVVTSAIAALLDSGAFTDPPTARLTPAQALHRQLTWERKASDRWGQDWQASYLSSYDLLIDETWVNGRRSKRRWSVRDADWAVRETVDAAAFIATERDRLQPRTLVLGVQGVDAIQYTECVCEVLRVAQPGDTIGLGGWCILGRFTSWLPEYWTTMRAILPLIAHAGISHVHLYGVLYQPAVGGLVWLADQYGISVSNDSAAPVLAATRGDPKKAGMRAADWRSNVAWWQTAMRDIRNSQYYREPPCPQAARQLSFV